MILQQYFAHVGPDKKSLSSWLSSAGYRYTVAGENLALGFDSAEAVMKAWQASPTHYANLVDKDFTQIGVSAVSGPYQDIDTTLVAQYFGTPPAVVAPLKPAPTLTKIGPAVKGSREPAIASQKETGAVPVASAVSQPIAKSSVGVTVSPLIPFDASRTHLWLDTPQGSQEAVARAEVALNGEAKEAQIIFSNYRLVLNKDEAGIWQGQAVINNRQDLEPIVPPTLRLVALDGTIATHSLSWDNLQPMASSAGERYLFLRQNPTPAVAKIFGFSDWFYRFILFGAVMSLSVAVVVEIKKQKPKLIISTGSLIVLLILLLIF
jgi:hypothetical protein